MPHESFDNKDLLAAKESKNGFSSFIEGLYEGASNVRNKPGETALSVVGGLAIGAGLQTVFNKAEGYGTLAGAAAGFAKKALAPAAIVLAGTHVRNAEDQFKEAGKQVFDMGLFLGAAKLGTYAEALPGLKSWLAPKAITPKAITNEYELPQSLKYRLENNQVHILSSADGAWGREQIRLSNEKGFLVSRRDYEGTTLPLINLPSQIPLGKLEYSRNQTSLQVGDTKYVHSLYDGQTIAKRGDDVFTVHSGNLQIFKGDTKTIYHPNGAVEVEIGNMQSGRNWFFDRDGSISMRSLPYGKDKITVGVDGKGFHDYKHGSMRIAGPRSNAAGFRESRTEVTLVPDRSGLQVGEHVWALPKPARLGDGTDPQKAVADFIKARQAIEGLYLSPTGSRL